MPITNTSKSLRMSIKAKLFGMTLLLGVCALGGSGAAMAQDLNPLPTPTPEQAADIQSIINTWHAYSFNLQSNNLDGVAVMGTPLGGYVVARDMDTLAPSASGARPAGSSAPASITDGGCVAMAGTGVLSYLIGQNFTPYRSLPTPGHQMNDPVVVLSPDSSTATLYVYFSNGRYANDFIRTQNGWKFQNIRIIWPHNGTAACLANWTPGVGKLQLLGDDLYYLHMLSGGPQLAAARAAEPALRRVHAYVISAMAQVNTLKYAQACPTINQMIAEATADPTLDADSKEFFQVIGTRFLEDNSCDGRIAPDRSHSTGGWASATYWRAYQLSGNPDAIATPATVPAWSATFVGSNQ